MGEVVTVATLARPGPPKAPVIHTPDERLRVFVSSTMRELHEERAAVRAAVTRLRLTPVMFESAARAHPPREVYEAYERRSDVFVGVYWRSYGWVAPGASVSGIEDEWLLAGDLPRLVYLKEPGSERDERLTELVSRIRSDDRTSYRSFRTADELQDMVENDLAVLLTDRFQSADGGTGTGTEPEPAARRLPVARTGLVGRTREIAEVSSLLTRPDVRLVSLTGPGGIGKTRLAVEVASRLEAQAAFPDGVRFVELASTTRPELVASAVADQLGVHASRTDEPAASALASALRLRRLLLVVDNLEQVLSAAPLLTDLLTAAPGLTILVTSRTVLNLRGEHDVPVPPLGLAAPGRMPGATDDLSAERIPDDDAARLFVARARAVDPRLRLDGANAGAVAEITRRLDGLPLAIELAASWVRLLPPPVLAQRLRDGLGLPGAGPADAPDRQRTLRSTIAWSYDLLTGQEQEVFDALGVFPGSFDLAAVEALCRGLAGTRAPDPLVVLGSLVGSSLVRSLPGDGRPLFGMLQTIREHARDRLRASGRWDRAHAVHAAHYLDVAESAGRGLRGDDQGPWLRRLESDHDNLRAALTWDLEHADVASAVRIGWGVWIFWWFGHLDEGVRWFETMATAAAPGPPYLHARALTGAGLMGFARGDLVRAEDALRESLTLYRSVGDAAGEALTAGALGRLASARGDQEAAAALLRSSLDLFGELGDDWYRALMLNFVGGIALARRDGARASRVFAEALTLSRRVGGGVPLLISLYNSAVADLAVGDLAGASTYFTEGLDRALEIGDPSSAAPFLSGLARTLTGRHPERAACLQGAADGLLLRSNGTAWLDAYTSRPDPVVRVAGRRARRSAALGRAWTTGRDIGVTGDPGALARVTRPLRRPRRHGRRHTVV